MPASRPPCTVCGHPTRSVARLCEDHRPSKTAKRPTRPCTECGETTMSTKGICRRCLKLVRPKEVIPNCTECGLAPAKKNEVMCVGCLGAITDDKPDRPGESPYDLDDIGVWRFDPVRRVQVLVPVAPVERAREQVAA